MQSYDTISVQGYKKFLCTCNIFLEYGMSDYTQAVNKFTVTRTVEVNRWISKA